MRIRAADSMKVVSLAGVLGDRASIYPLIYGLDEGLSA